MQWKTQWTEDKRRFRYTFDVIVGSALDLFGGKIPFEKLKKLC